MVDSLKAAMAISGSGLEAQTQKMRIVSENLANAFTTGTTAGSDPYQRKTITFSSEMDKAFGVNLVKVRQIGHDGAAFVTEYDPTHIAADDKGMVKKPNVDPLLEMADMRETAHAYEANMQAMKQARDLINMAIDMMRG
ncbi:MAG: flagellar basal body rod protein FlgC [Rhizobiaceae bacterium]|nr:flagellar basal body rod protein FlgC [Rhizobiaceae bacterium]